MHISCMCRASVEWGIQVLIKAGFKVLYVHVCLHTYTHTHTHTHTHSTQHTAHTHMRTLRTLQVIGGQNTHLFYYTSMECWKSKYWETNWKEFLLYWTLLAQISCVSMLCYVLHQSVVVTHTFAVMHIVWICCISYPVRWNWLSYPAMFATFVWVISAVTRRSYNRFLTGPLSGGE